MFKVIFRVQIFLNDIVICSVIVDATLTYSLNVTKHQPEERRGNKTHRIYNFTLNFNYFNQFHTESLIPYTVSVAFNN